MKPKHLIISLIAISLAFYGCKKDNGLTEEQKTSFYKTYGVNTTGVDFELTSDGGYILVGNEQRGDNSDIILIKADAYGNTQWTKYFSGPLPNRDDVAGDIEITSDGGYAIIGSSIMLSDTFPDAPEIKVANLIITDANGNFIDSRLFGDPDRTLYESGNGLTVTSNGDIALACSRENIINGTTTATNYIVSGDDLSLLVENNSATYTSDFDEFVFTNVIEISSGNIVFIGLAEGESDGAKGKNLILVDFNKDLDYEGNAQFGGDELDQGFDVVQLDAGNLVAVGYKSLSNNTRNIFVFETNEASAPSNWESEIPLGTGNSEGYGIEKVSDGYLIAGKGSYSGLGEQMALVKISTTGELMWSKDFGYLSNDEARAVKELSDGNIALFGTCADERGNTTMCMIKTNSNGELIR